MGGHLAGAVPSADGLNALAMVQQPRKAYLLLGLEPDLDHSNPVAAMGALSSAQLVVALSAFVSPSLREVADVMLPIAPFTETSGTFVSCEGRAQTFNAVARPLGETRPGWKVLRVLGNLVQADGFDYADSEAVRADALGSEFAVRLDNRLELPTVAVSTLVDTALERVADVPIHFADPLVRRAPSLQKTRDAATPAARMASSTLAALGLQSGDRVRVKGVGQIEILAVADEGLAPGCVRIAAAHSATSALGPMSGVLSVERV